MPFRKGKSGNPNGRPKKTDIAPVINADDATAEVLLAELARIATNPKLAPTARCTAVNSYLSRTQGLPNKMKPEADSITESTAQTLCHLADLLRRDQTCPNCHHVFTV